MRYTGMLTDSTVFDYTATYRSPRKVFRKGDPGVGRWVADDENGGKAKLTIPRRWPTVKRAKFNIPGCAVLVFEIELLGIESNVVEPSKTAGLVI